MAKRTPLYDTHLALGARIIDFGGWDMPVQYPTGILAEHAATRERAGLFDTCHMGEIELTAPDVRAALNALLPCDVSKLKPGRERYTFLTAEDGTVIDDAVIFLRDEGSAMICINAGDISGDVAFLQDHLPAGAELRDVSDATGKLDIQGPEAWRVVQALTGIDLRSMPFFSFLETTWAGAPFLLSRSGYTGEPGVEFFLPAEKTVELWEAILAAGKGAETESGMAVTPCGLGARDTLRLEAGLPLYGHEMDRSTNPIQAGFGRFVALDKPEDFPGKAALRAAAATLAETDTLVGLTIEGKRVAREGCAVLAGEGGATIGRATIGRVTSGAPAPTVGGNIALAYVKPGFTETGTAVAVDVRGKAIPASVRALPFYSTPRLRERLTTDR